MRSFIRYLFLPLTRWLVKRFSSNPDAARIFSALTELKQKVENDPGKKGFIIPFDSSVHKFIIFSDQHKGRKNGSDDFANAEKTYLDALTFYDEEKFHLISLGDSEELWENTWLQVRLKNKLTFDAEKRFLKDHRFTKIFGNHDLDWSIDPLAPTYLYEVYDQKFAVLQGVVLETKISGETLKFLCTHGHQGDRQSDGNWFSKFFVSKVWGPWQSYLRINPNTPSENNDLKSLHNLLMHQWSAQQSGVILITGHTHQPVFESLTHWERLERKRQKALAENNPEWAKAIADEMSWQRKERLTFTDYTKAKPSYFNSGCCCYADGDITGIEIAESKIHLVRWKTTDGATRRQVLESAPLSDILKRLK
jgi:predicted phosphodiesterase